MDIFYLSALDPGICEWFEHKKLPKVAKCGGSSFYRIYRTQLELVHAFQSNSENCKFYSSYALDNLTYSWVV